MIENDLIKAKIDSNAKLLYSRKSDTQRETYIKALHLGKTYIRETENALLKMNMIRSDMVLKREQKGY